MKSENHRVNKTIENKKSDLKNERPSLETMYLDSAQIKQMLKVSDSTLYRWRQNKILAFKQIGKKFYYPYQLIINFMESGMNR